MREVRIHRLLRPVTQALALCFLLPLLPEKAHAAEGGWYAKPQLNFRGVRVNDRSTFQGTLGAEGGLRYPLGQRVSGRTRVGGMGIYGINSGSLGGDFRIGSFIGPWGKKGFVQVGPDLWFNGYGNTDSTDYHLPWGPGLSLPVVGSMALHSSFRLVTSINPGWAFSESRRGGGIGPFDELTLLAAGVIKAGAGHVTLGYQHSWNQAGQIQGLILSGGL